MKHPLLIACAIVTVATLAAAVQEPGPTAKPVDVFAPFEGKWSGTFVGYDPRGKELYRIRVEQTYATIDDHTQNVTIRDIMPDGKVIAGNGRNTAHRGPDGSLVLKCVVDKSNGDHVEHTGRVVTGPSGRVELVWYSDAKDRTETFREWSHQRGEHTYYSIHGMGRYGDTLMLMAGEYHKTPQ